MKKRWTVKVTNTSGGSYTIQIDELYELQDHIEHGYDFRLIKDIVITYNLGD